jgi:outer membrane receptor protein involved in Fe transport
MKIERSLVLLVFVALAAPAAAQSAGQEQPDPPEPLPAFRTEIVVTPERGADRRIEVPAATAVLSREDIDRLPAQDLAGVLQNVAGFQVLFGQPFGIVPIVSARGFFGGGEAEYLHVLVDGVPLLDVESGLVDWRLIRTSAIERLEVVRGPASALYGDTALGGVVHVFTVPPARRGGRVSLSGGSFASGSVDGGAHHGFGRWRAGVAGSMWRTDGFRERSAARDGSLDVWTERAAGSSVLRLRASASAQRTQLPGPRTEHELAADRFGSDPSFGLNRDTADRFRLGTTYQNIAGDMSYVVRIHASARDASRLRTLLLAPGLGVRADRSITATSTGVVSQGERAFRGAGGEGHVRGGLEFTHERLWTDYADLLPGGQRGRRIADAAAWRTRAGVYISSGWHPLERVRFSTGLRWDGIADQPRAHQLPRVADHAWSPRVGLTILSGPADRAPLAVFLQASRAFKAPTLDQRFDPQPFPDFRGGTFTVSNPGLRAQRVTNLEVGASRAHRQASWQVVAYRSTVDDEIDFDLATFRYGNIGRSRHIGLEVEARVFPMAVLSPAISYAWTRVRALEPGAPPGQLKNIPEHVWQPSLQLGLPAQVNAELRYTRTSGAFLDDDNEAPLRSAGVFDVRAGRAIGRLRLAADLLNLSDARYEAYGFTLRDFQDRRVDYYYPGSGRAVRLEAGLRF